MHLSCTFKLLLRPPPSHQPHVFMSAAFWLKPWVTSQPFHKGFAHKVTFAKGARQPLQRVMQGVKRLRGVDIEKEKLKPGKKTFEKGKSSKLATALLSLWALL